MSARAIREHDGKVILGKYVPSLAGNVRAARISVELKASVAGALETVAAQLQGSRDTLEAADLSARELQQQLHERFAQAEAQHPWLRTSRLVAKPDQLIKRRGKGGLLCLDCTWPEAQAWIAERAGREIEVPRAPWPWPRSRL